MTTRKIQNLTDETYEIQRLITIDKCQLIRTYTSNFTVKKKKILYVYTVTNRRDPKFKQSNN